MIKTKKILLTMLITALTVFVMLLTLSMGSTFADVIRPHNPSQELQLELELSGDKLTASATEIEGYTYQYWIKTKVATDNSPNLAGRQFIWQLVSEYGGSSSAELTVGPDNVDEYGRYSVIVRIMDGETLVDEIYGTYSPASISEIRANGKAIEGELIVSKSGTVDINIMSAGNIETYLLYHKGDKDEPLSGTNGEFKLSFDTFESGYHTFKAEIEAATGEKASKSFTVYVYDEYVAQQRPVITSLKGVTDWDNGGLTVFTMNVEYADGTPIPYEKASDFKFSLTSGSITAAPVIVEKEGGSFDVQFTVDYNGKKGIYYTVGKVSRDSITGDDDKIIRYYEGYARAATLSQSAKDSSGKALSDNTISAGQPVTITAEGSITGSSKLQYAFYREDASGWVLIRDYQESNTFTWTPIRPGQYNIQVRVKDKDAGSYEKAVTVRYLITGVNLEGSLNVDIIDYESGAVATDDLVTGKPYKLAARYSGTESNLLYMFTLTTSNLGTVYLSKFSPSPYLMFIPSKADNYVITARVITTDSFGYKDKSEYAAVTSGKPGIAFKDVTDGVADVDAITGSAYNFDNNVIVSGASGYSVKIDGAEIPGTTYTFSEEGEYIIEVSANNKIGTATKSFRLFASDPDTIVNFAKASYDLTVYTAGTTAYVATLPAATLGANGHEIIGYSVTDGEENIAITSGKITVAEDATSYTITVTAANAYGVQATATATLNIVFEDPYDFKSEGSFVVIAGADYSYSYKNPSYTGSNPTLVEDAEAEDGVALSAQINPSNPHLALFILFNGTEGVDMTQYGGLRIRFKFIGTTDFSFGANEGEIAWFGATYRDRWVDYNVTIDQLIEAGSQKGYGNTLKRLVFTQGSGTVLIDFVKLIPKTQLPDENDPNYSYNIGDIYYLFNAESGPINVVKRSGVTIYNGAADYKALVSKTGVTSLIGYEVIADANATTGKAIKLTYSGTTGLALHFNTPIDMTNKKLEMRYRSISGNVDICIEDHTFLWKNNTAYETYTYDDTKDPFKTLMTATGFKISDLFIGLQTNGTYCIDYIKIYYYK